MIGNKWSVKAEYLYYDLGYQSYTVFSQSPAGLAGMQADASFRGHIARSGLNYKFNTTSYIESAVTLCPLCSQSSSASAAGTSRQLAQCSDMSEVGGRAEVAGLL
jgi:hypothetical protein